MSPGHSFVSFVLPVNTYLEEGARSEPRQRARRIEDLDSMAPRSATTRSMVETTNFGGRPATNADCYVSRGLGVAARVPGRVGGLDCRKFRRFKTGAAVQLVWTRASCASGFAFS